MNANDMQSNFQFCGFRILRFNMSNDFVNLPSEDELSETPIQSTNVKYEIVSIEKKEGYHVGILRLHINTAAAATDGNTEQENKLDADLWIEGCYILIGDLPDEDIQKFLIINGSASLYSIARSFIAGVTAQSMNSGSLMLPMISTYALYAAEDPDEVVDKFE